MGKNLSLAGGWEVSVTRLGDGWFFTFNEMILTMEGAGAVCM